MTGAAALLLAAPTHLSAQSPFVMKTEDGSTSVSVGMLAQPQLELERSDGDTGAGLCFRRLRLISGGSVLGKFKYFVEWDAPHLGVHTANQPVDVDVFLQDLILTYEWRDELRLEGGLMMVPLSYNTTQSAASLLGTSYGPYSFLASAPTTSTVGRDYGVQARGYVARRHVEYRLGAFEGVRELDPTAPRRIAGRVVWYPFDAQTGFFYTGTTLGKSRILAVGASVDRQGSYTSRAVDVFLDQPLPSGHVVSAQFDYMRYDGGETIARLPRQAAWLAEGGYFWKSRKLSAFVQIARRDLAAAGAADALSYQTGVGYWPRGHRLNVKVAAGGVHTDRAPRRALLTVESQVFAF
jgi:hypothetical protein